MVAEKRSSSFYIVIGFFIGLLFPVFATIVAIYNLDTDETINLPFIFSLHLKKPLLLIIDLAIPVLTIAVYIIGSRQEKLKDYAKQLQDLNEHKDDTLKALNLELEEKNEDLNKIMYVTSHELKSTIRGISTLTNFLKEENAEEEKLHLELLLQKRIDRMEKLLNAMLVYLRFSNKTNNRTNIDLNKLFKKVVLDYPNVKFHIADNLPTVYFDVKKLSFVFRELIENSIKFSVDDPEIEVVSEILDDAFQITFRDNGIGILPEYREKVFDLYATIENKDSHENIGAGLAIVKRVMVEGDGTIEILDNPENNGTVFRLTLKK